MNKNVLLAALLILIGIAMKIIGPPAILDARLYYTGDEARELFVRFDEHQKQAYFINEILDFAFIATYTALFFMGVRKVLPELTIVAFVPGIFDVIETAAILYATKTEGPYSFFDWLGYVTLLKWLTGTIIAAVLIRKKLTPST